MSCKVDTISGLADILRVYNMQMSFGKYDKLQSIKYFLFRTVSSN